MELTVASLVPKAPAEEQSDSFEQHENKKNYTEIQAAGIMQSLNE